MALLAGKKGLRKVRSILTYGDDSPVYRAAGKPAIAGASESKAVFLRDRHNIIKQIVLRNENFSPPAFAGRDRANYLKVSCACRTMITGY